jgi:glucokinase
MLLAGDVGGTKTELAVFAPERGPHAPLAHERFRSASYPGLDAMAREFLEKAGLSVTDACFDVPGPVVDGRAQLTNLVWILTALEHGSFMDAFRRKGRFADLLDQRPVHVIVDDAALLGVATYGLSLLDGSATDPAVCRDDDRPDHAEGKVVWSWG